MTARDSRTTGAIDGAPTGAMDGAPTAAMDGAPTGAMHGAMHCAMDEAATDSDVSWAELQTAWCRALFAGLAGAGVEHVVVSPGSRSTPLVLAAAAQPGLTLYDVVDERSAAFFALGQARVTGRASVLIATSGTAGAHYLPAVIEAGLSQLPLLILTADRPPELAACSAPQTIDQLHLYGRHARAFFELGTPNDLSLSRAAVRRMAVQAELGTRFPQAGAVHVNVRARKPLEPSQAPFDFTPERAARDVAGGAPSADHSAPQGSPPEVTRVSVPTWTPEPAAIEALAERMTAARRGVIVKGPAAVADGAWTAQLLALAARLGFVVLAEPASQLRFAPSVAGVIDPRVDGYDTFLSLSAVASGLGPDFVLQLGAPPTSRALSQYLAACGVGRTILARDGWNDPDSSATHLIFGDVGSATRALSAQLELRSVRPDPQWAESWRVAERGVAGAVEAVLSELESPLTEAEVVRAVVDSLGEGELLALGNSLPIRHVETWCPGGKARLAVLSQRGANGIDGLISGAAGAALAAGRRVTLILGDVSTVHDLNGLDAARRCKAPVTVVVIHNGGGRIFEQLPIASRPAHAEVLEHFTTPHELPFARAAEVLGVHGVRVDHRRQLTPALAAAAAIAGPALVEAVVPPHGARTLSEALREETARRLEPGDFYEDFAKFERLP